jgi:hypothetical protein
MGSTALRLVKKRMRTRDLDQENPPWWALAIQDSCQPAALAPAHNVSDAALGTDPWRDLEEQPLSAIVLR